MILTDTMLSRSATCTASSFRNSRSRVLLRDLEAVDCSFMFRSSSACAFLLVVEE